MKSQYLLPLTIVVAGLIIAGAVFLSAKNGTPSNNNGSQQATNFRAVDSTDHTLGSPNATVQVIEYADLECPYCKVFETTMHQVMSYYGQSGQVSWTYRPFPLTQIHSKAPKEAEAAECAADQGGNTAFFNYTDQIYNNSPLENGLDLTQLPVFAKNIGLNVDTFNTCLNSGKYSQKVQDSYNEAIKEGGTGTPFILITKPGSTDAIVLEGAQPYDSMRAAIDQLLGSAASTSAASTSAATQ
ncbi:MAG TPA: thioredoxin domain-containing protein [Candidatus Paceibacterota bacterium]|nr:thioredoxin domain-containing protein [Candidatus Paceibacterota bacterium]